MDRITRVRIANVRSIEYVDLEISPLTVLIGENGSGKSTIIEVLELLRKAAEPSFLQQFYAVHRGLAGLLRKGATSLTLGVVIEDEARANARLEYSFELAARTNWAEIAREHLVVGGVGEEGTASVVVDRVASRVEVFSSKEGRLVPSPPQVVPVDQLAITTFGSHPPHAAITRLLTVLGGIEVHLPFDTLASWVARSYQFGQSLRGSTTYLPADRLSLLGFNFANAWAALKNRDSQHWEHTLALVRLGIGEAVDTIVVTPDPGGGLVAVSVKRRDLEQPLQAADLSDGQLAWLAFVAMTRLNAGRSLLAIDEPESHLHPSLLGRVVELLKCVDGGAPVLVSTHSDRVLELVDEPARSIRVCQLDEKGSSSVTGLEEEHLALWLKEFGDVAQLRASGYLPRVLKAAAKSDRGKEAS